MNGDINALRIDVDALIKAGLPANLLASLLTVDGATSGLDADKLDGVELSTIYSRYDFKTITTEDLNNCYPNGVYIQPSDANALISRNYPVGNAGILETFNSGSWVTQRYSVYSNGISFVRKYQNWSPVGWSAWIPEAGFIKHIDIGNNYGVIHFGSGLLIQWGVVVITTTANAPTGAWITFHLAFDTIPVVQVTANTSVPGSYVLDASFASLQTTGTNIWVYRTNSTSMSVNWFAIGYKT